MSAASPAVRPASAAGTGWLATLAGRPAAWAVVLAVALAARLVVVFTAPHGIPWSDGRAYESAGWILASQHRYTADFFLPPLYPFFIAGVYSIIGHHLLGLRLVEALVSTLTAGLIGGFGARLFRPSAGLVAMSIAALHPVLVLLPVTHYVETLLLLLATLAFGSYALALRRPTNSRFLLTGLVYGLALLCKPTLTALLPGLAIGTLVHLRREGFLRIARWGALFALAIALAITPWIVRDHEVYGRWYFITAGGGRQFWMGNNAQYQGSTQFNPRPTPAMLDSMATLPSYTDAERFYYREGVRFIREHPGSALHMYFLKMRNLWALYPRTQARTIYTVPLADWTMGIVSVVVYAGALLGLGIAVAEGMGAFLFAIVSYTLMCSLYLTVMRYRMSVEVILLWLAGAGWAALLERRTLRPRH